MNSHNSPASTYTLTSNDIEHRRLRTQAENLRAHTLALIDAIDLPPGSSAIDVGCGPGGVLDLLSERVGASGRVVCVDFDAASVAMASAFAFEKSDVDQ